MAKLDVLALDLEGTLVSNAVSQIARPGLYEFLEFCRRVVPRLVIYTSVPEATVRDVIANLVADESAPGWFQDVECVRWNGSTKDLTVIPRARVESTVLIDDYEGYVLPSQRQQWLAVEPYSAPYASDDKELERVMHVLQDDWDCHAG